MFIYTLKSEYKQHNYINKGVALQYILYADLHPQSKSRSKSQVKSQVKNPDKSKVKQ